MLLHLDESLDLLGGREPIGGREPTVERLAVPVSRFVEPPHRIGAQVRQVVPEFFPERAARIPVMQIATMNAEINKALSQPVIFFGVTSFAADDFCLRLNEPLSKLTH